MSISKIPLTNVCAANPPTRERILEERSSSFVAITANILGAFQDPFEFQGDYGPKMNPVRNRVFELVLPQEDPGVTFAELIPQELLQYIKDPDVLEFLHQNGHRNAFSFLRNCPKNLLRFDKALNYTASKEGRLIELSILSSSYPIKGSTPTESKRILLDQLSEEKNSKLVKAKEIVEPEYHAFKSRLGHLLFYWMYQSLNLHLIGQEPGLVQSVNKTKDIFIQTLGNAEQRAKSFKERLLDAEAKVLFTQEADHTICQTLTSDHTFFEPKGQIATDGSFILLKPDMWEEDAYVIPLDNYSEYSRGKVNMVLATSKINGEKFLLASGHGSSTNPQDGREQISKIMEKFGELSLEYPGLQILIGMDANTKKKQDVKNFFAHLDDFGLMATQVGVTTIKQRMVTVQHKKSGRVAMDEEDFLITLKPERNGKFALENPTVGFKSEAADLSAYLPNLENQSDHYPIGATVQLADSIVFAS